MAGSSCGDIQVLRINGSTGAVDFIGPELPGAEKYWGAAVLGKRVYAMPSKARRALRIDCGTGEVELIGPELPGDVHKYGRATAVVGGSIYAFPWDATRILRMKGSTEGFDFLGPDVEGGGSYRYAAAVGQHVYAIPNNATQVLHVNHSTGECGFIGPKMGGEWKYDSGAVAGERIYAVPLCATKVMRIEGGTGQVDLVGPEFKEGDFNYSTSAVVGTSVYGIPFSAGKVLRVDDATGAVDFCGPDLTGKGKYDQQHATVLNGSIYAVPCNAARALCLRPPPPAATAVAPLPSPPPPPGPSSAAMDFLRASNRWGVEIANVLTGTFSFFPPGFVPTRTAAECLAHMTFAGQPEVLLKATEATAAKPPETRGYAMVIYAYTLESPLYTQLTASMRKTDEELLANYREYIYHMEKALNRQPCFGGVAFRGIDILVPKSVYEPGSIVTWQSFSSATRKMLVLLKFLKITDVIKLSGTVFLIKSCNARCVRSISAFPLEDEVVFGPNTHFRVEDMVKEESGKRACLPDLEDYNIDCLKVFKLVEL